MWKNAINKDAQRAHPVITMLWAGRNGLDLAWEWPTKGYNPFSAASFRIYNSRRGKKWNPPMLQRFYYGTDVLYCNGVRLIIQQIVMELPVEHGLLLDNLLDLAHAPFTHTSTFAKGWSVPRYTYLSYHFEKLTNKLWWSWWYYVCKSTLMPCYFSQLGEVFDTCVWAPRVLGSLPDWHGVPTAVHGLIDHWHLKAWKTRREEHPAMLYTSPPAPCLLALL